MKTIKIKISQELLQDLLDTAVQDHNCEVWIRLILTDLRVRKNDLFLFKKEQVELRLKPFEAIALWRYVQYKQVEDAYLEAFEMINCLLKNGIVTQKELTNL